MSCLAQRALWFGDPAAARPLADRAWELAHVQAKRRRLHLTRRGGKAKRRWG